MTATETQTPAARSAAIRSRAVSARAARTRRATPRGSRAPRPNRLARRRLDAVTILTGYLILLLAVPSSLTVTALGSAGRPAALWALGAALWWAWFQIQRHRSTGSVPNIVKIAVFVFIGVVLVGYAWAMLRGLPADEVSPADSGLLRIAGWAGIALLASDGITDRGRFTVLLRRIAIGGALMATLGLLQTFTGDSLLGWISIPGLSSDTTGLAGLDTRAGFTRASATATHPLEYGVVLSTAFPIAISFALNRVDRFRVIGWIPVAIMGAAAVLAVSRSALIGLVAAVLVLLPGWSRRVRIGFGAAAGALVIAVGIAVPGILGTLRGLFTGISDDSSAQSRVGSYDSAVEFISRFPLFGKGFGTFLPRYHILDNQYLLLTIETGLIGLAAFAAILVTAAWSVQRARRFAPNDLERGLLQSVLASLVAGSVLLAFFDGFSFPMSAGMVFLVIGLCGAARRLWSPRGGTPTL